jgi:hypothetical protein
LIILYFIKLLVNLPTWPVTSGDVRERSKVADAASDLQEEVFGKDKSPCRLVYGVARLPLGTAVELEVIFEVARQERLRGGRFRDPQTAYEDLPLPN